MYIFLHLILSIPKYLVKFYFQSSFERKEEYEGRSFPSDNFLLVDLLAFICFSLICHTHLGDVSVYCLVSNRCSVFSFLSSVTEEMSIALLIVCHSSILTIEAGVRTHKRYALRVRHRRRRRNHLNLASRI